MTKTVKRSRDLKIAILGLIKSENIGEQFIARSLEYLIKTEAEKIDPDIDIEFTEVDLLGRNDEIVECTGSYKKRVLNYYNYSEKGIRTEASGKAFLMMAFCFARSFRESLSALVRIREPSPPR